MSLGVAIVGCGLIGRRRADALSGGHLVACADVVRERAEDLARSHPNVAISDDWRAVIDRRDVDVVVVSTTNNMLAKVSRFAVQSGKHVLVEKPAARSVAELATVIEAVEDCRGLVRVGFNHRYHPALLRALELCKAGELGEMMFVRGRYGHGGRLGYEKEWRADPILSGGGELLDQGVHLIDLSRRFLGDFSSVNGFAHTFYWPMDVDDNAFLLLRTASERTAFLHVSCTEWKNLFSFEIYGRSAKLQVDGLGGSYGIERLAFYKMRPEMGPPDTTIWEYPGPDESWTLEFRDFLDDIRFNRPPAASLADALAALEIVERIHATSGYVFESKLTRAQ